MVPKLILSGILALLAGGNTDEVKPGKPYAELLTQQEWVLTGYGYDKNDNGIVDPAENLIQDCERDNSYIFRQNGTGSYYDNLVSCGDGLSDYHFVWKLLHNESVLDFSAGQCIIVRINEKEMITCDDSSSGAKLLTTFRH